MKPAEVKGCVHRMRSHYICCPMNQALLENPLEDGISVVSEHSLYVSRAPSEVRALIAAPSSPVLTGTSALFTYWVKGAIPEDSIRHVSQFIPFPE